MSTAAVPRHERIGIFTLGAVQFVNILDFMMIKSPGRSSARRCNTLFAKACAFSVPLRWEYGTDWEVVGQSSRVIVR